MTAFPTTRVHFPKSNHIAKHPIVPCDQPIPALTGPPHGTLPPQTVFTLIFVFNSPPAFIFDENHAASPDQCLKCIPIPGDQKTLLDKRHLISFHFPSSLLTAKVDGTRNRKAQKDFTKKSGQSCPGCGDRRPYPSLQPIGSSGRDLSDQFMIKCYRCSVRRLTMKTIQLGLDIY